MNNTNVITRTSKVRIVLDVEARVVDAALNMAKEVLKLPEKERKQARTIRADLLNGNCLWFAAHSPAWNKVTITQMEEHHE